MDQIAFILIAFVASFASAIFGFGSALLVLAFGSLVLPVKETIALATVLFTASAVTKSLLFRDHIEWKMVGVMSFACLPFTYLGAQLLAVASAEVVKPMLGVMVLIYLAVTATKRLPSISFGMSGLFAGSALYGFVSGFLVTCPPSVPRS
ncbi:TSUP family transporter [Sedimentitalea sp. XS_ASV28]|uniref:TSUP family transporter n=1 Tax=Sedimentitalea sp. XS_ASV28 TaxID=3241296 RepID=UPI00351786E1